MRVLVPVSRLDALLKSPPRRFAVSFALLSAALLSAYYFPYPPSSSVKGWLDGYLRTYASLAGGVLRWVEPTVRVEGQDILGRFSLRIVKTCDAMDVQILFASAVLAWPGGWRTRALAACAGVVALSIVNVVRICTLYYVGVLFPSSFEFVHLELWPAVIVILAVAGFIGFTIWARRETDLAPVAT